ncbi:MAG: Gfo/Idh/MocA family oxidoreductase [Albidovulum sp.]|nr:Gfo/Idh/MocA family oxidoreductase [Albidovulum sp.]
MNLYSLLAKRHALGRPIKVGLIGAGKFGSMHLAQVPRMNGYSVACVADLDVSKANAALRRVGWPKDRYSASSVSEACCEGKTFVSDDPACIFQCEEIDCVIEATGDPLGGASHALAAIESGKHVVMVNVEADALCGPWLAARARDRNLVYSMAYGDQPAIICELIDWARACGFDLTAAGKGMKFEPHYRYSTPETVWKYYGWSEREVAEGDFNPKLFNSFTDGTKSAIEMVAVSNASGLDCPENGLEFPPSGARDLANVFRPASDGGRLERSGLVEIASSQSHSGVELVDHLRFGVFVTFRAHNDYARDCFRQYGLLIDDSGWYASMWRPFHLIGLEVGISSLSAVLRGEATGSPLDFRSDAIAVAKTDLASGTRLDGEGGYTVWGRAVPAEKSLALDALPIGLAHNARLKNPVGRDCVVRHSDVELGRDSDAIRLRKEMVASKKALASGPIAGRGFKNGEW